MTLAVCYHARIQARDQFEDRICKYFTAPMKEIEKKTFKQEISRLLKCF